MSADSIKTDSNASLPYPPELVRQRYDRLAQWYRTFEWVLWLPRGIRNRAVRKLELEHGDVVLEVGCGTGRNLPYLEAAVGPSGHVLGVRSLRKDAQPGAGIVRAQRLEKCHARLHGRTRLPRPLAA